MTTTGSYHKIGIRGKDMKTIYDNIELIQKIMDLIENHFGPKCEIVLHDNTKEYEHTIVDIRNGYITNRKIGDGGGAWGLEVMTNQTNETCRYNKLMVTDNNHIIRNSSIFFQSDDHKNIGSLCLNFDITELVRLQDVIDDYTLKPKDLQQPRENFINDVNQLLDNLLKQCHDLNPKETKLMSKKEKIELIKFLDYKGAFLITKSGERICDYLGISKFTLYNYLDIARNHQKS